MSKINFLKPDKENIDIFLYMGSFLFVISVIDVSLNSFFSLNITGFLPSSLSFVIPIILGFIGLYFIRIEHSGNKFLDQINKNKPMYKKVVKLSLSGFKKLIFDIYFSLIAIFLLYQFIRIEIEILKLR